jgi:hypothetical protein
MVFRPGPWKLTLHYLCCADRLRERRDQKKKKEKRKSHAKRKKNCTALENNNLMGVGSDGTDGTGLARFPTRGRRDGACLLFSFGLHQAEGARASGEASYF